MPLQNDEKLSEEDSKENLSEAFATPSANEATCSRPLSSEDNQDMLNYKTVESTTPLTVNCDTTSDTRPELTTPFQ